MTQIRADVAELLRAGYGDRTIARHLGIGWRDVNRARHTLGIPPCKPGTRKASTPEDLFWRRVKPVDGGHMEWTGGRSNGSTPSFMCGDQRISAYRIAFRIKHGREPEGYLRPSCGHEGCVAPGHHDDRAIRDRDNTAFDAIFGGPA